MARRTGKQAAAVSSADHKKPLMVRVREDLYAQLDAYCLEEGHTKTWVIEKAVAEYLKKK